MNDSDDNLLGRILRQAPFGLSVTAPDGTTVFAGAAGDRADPGLPVETRRFSAVVDHTAYRIDLALDESERDRREQELVQRAFFDGLTKLPNRLLMERSVAALIESETVLPFAIAFFDLDGFKNVNDYYGHDAGDELLAQVSRRLQSCLRPTDMVARLSGDEFAMLISPAGDPRTLRRDMEWLAERIKEPVLTGGHEIFASASIGVSMFPEHGKSFEELRANADRAMYRAKGTLKGSVQFFDVSIEHASQERARAEQRLRLAIRDRRVCCAYQPKVEMRTGEVVGVEVLMRWRDDNGLIQARGDFLALAVELGLMDDLTQLVLEETINSIDEINEAFGPQSTISINVAPRQASDLSFMRSMIGTIAESGFAGRFILELTEEAFLVKSDFQTRILPMVREVGARVSIDDFGIGYSSLSALADIEADEVKIDRAFITDVHKRPRSQAILRAIEALAHSLDMTIIVEGVETVEELTYLQAATRIKYAQGFYFSQPMLLREALDGPGSAFAKNVIATSRHPQLARLASR
jgi:diguanylate cyclase (GGDEF)-like protein